MPKKHTVAPASATSAPPLPARLSELLVALPVFAWVENSAGEILMQGNARVSRADMARPAPCPLPKTGIRRGAGRSTRDARATRITTYPLPPIKGCPQGLRLVTLAPDAREVDGNALVIASLLALLLGDPHPDRFHLTPQQRAILDKLSQSLSYKETAYELRISHDTVLTQVARIRKRHGFGVIPRQRRRKIATGTLS